MPTSQVRISSLIQSAVCVLPARAAAEHGLQKSGMTTRIGGLLEKPEPRPKRHKPLRARFRTSSRMSSSPPPPSALLPDDENVETRIASVQGIEGRELIVRRFDRRPSRRTKIHFEEFNRLFGRRSGDDKYDSSYEDMARFIRNAPDAFL